MCTTLYIRGVRSRLVRQFKLPTPDPRGLSCTNTSKSYTQAVDICVFTQAKSVECYRDVVERRRRRREEEGCCFVFCVCVIFWTADDLKKMALFVCKRTQCAVTLQAPADTYYCDSLCHTHTRAHARVSANQNAVANLNLSNQNILLHFRGRY